MSWHTWISFFVASCLIALSPGPGALLSMSHGMAYGIKKASGTIAGLELGALLLFFVAGAGVGSLLLASEHLFMIIKTVGALYLVYLGLSQWRAKVEVASSLASDEQQTTPVRTQAPALKKRIAQGFLTNATNPKGIVFMVAVLPQFIHADAPLLPQLGVLALTMLCVDVIVMHGYALAASGMQGFFRNARAVKRQNRFFGGVLMGMGAALFLVKRTA
jgi:homoserine/homoserine lactone efflux protein